MLEQPLQWVGAETLARLRHCTLADKRGLRIRHGQPKLIEHFADRFVAVQRQRNHQPSTINHQPDYLLGWQTPMADARCLGALHSLFDPLKRQVFSESPPVRGLEMIGKKMKGVVEHCDEG